jgi:hypothetical protein
MREEATFCLTLAKRFVSDTETNTGYGGLDVLCGVNPGALQLGAGDGTRTHDILLGKQTLYQLSYTRVTSATRKYNT